MSRSGVKWAKRVRGLKREAKDVLLLLAEHEGDDAGPFAPHPGALIVESGLGKRRFDSNVKQLQMRGLVTVELRLAEGVRRNWYQFNRQWRNGADAERAAAEPAPSQLSMIVTGSRGGGGRSNLCSISISDRPPSCMRGGAIFGPQGMSDGQG